MISVFLGCEKWTGDMKTDSERGCCVAGRQDHMSRCPQASERLLQRTLRERSPLGSLPLELAEDTFLWLGISQSVVLCYGRPRILRHW